jgi:hypothetical protein
MDLVTALVTGNPIMDTRGPPAGAARWLVPRPAAETMP